MNNKVFDWNEQKWYVSYAAQKALLPTGELLILDEHGCTGLMASYTARLETTVVITDPSLLETVAQTLDAEVATEVGKTKAVVPAKVQGNGPCPTCGAVLKHDDHAANCPTCGQPLQWTCR